MELAGRRESSLKRRAAAAVSAENAAGRADDLMKRMLEDATRSENGGSVGVLSSEPHTTGNVTSGGMLDALGPVGPPLSFSPGEPRMLVENDPKGNENLEVKQRVEKTPDIKRVVVSETQQPGNPQRDERLRPSAEPVQRAVNEHGFMGATGKGRGSGSESRRIEPRQQVAVEGRSLARVESVSQGCPI